MADKAASHAGTGILAFLIGAGAGIAAGILFAPKKGSETRDQIKQKAVAARAKVQAGMQKEKDMVSDAIDTAKHVAEEGRQALKDAV